MNRFLFTVLISFFSIHVQAEPEPDSWSTTVLSQTLTLAPSKLVKYDFPQPVKNTRGSTELVVRVDRKIEVLFDNRPTEYHVLLDGKEVGEFKFHLLTDKGRKLSMRAIGQSFTEPGVNDLVFKLDLPLKKKELGTGINLMCDKKITILRMDWVDAYPK